MEPADTEPRRGEVPPEAVSALVQELRARLDDDFGTDRFRVADGWIVVGVEPRRFFRRWVPVVALRRGAESLCFIVTPTDDTEPCFERTPIHDVTYFSEDVPDDAQAQIFRRDRETILAFADWMSRRDAEALRPR